MADLTLIMPDAADGTPVVEDLSGTISESAQGPRRASGDSGSIEQHSLPDLIASDRYMASKASVGNAFKRCGREKIVPPGAS